METQRNMIGKTSEKTGKTSGKKIVESDWKSNGKPWNAIGTAMGNQNYFVG